MSSSDKGTGDLPPDAQPWDNLLLIIGAAIIVWLKRHVMFQSGFGVSNILMPEEDSWERQKELF